ncbi:MAG TPA: thioesterase domain-containing protein [Jatrophihabitans sp.]|nr:thioesterase domain-containing protein [Jatrophihabitans sp.]
MAGQTTTDLAVRPAPGARRAPGRWLLRQPQELATARLFCFPYAGVGASMYQRWPARVGPAEVCLLQLPGRENRIREPHYGDYESLADQLVEQLLPYLDRPFAFFGHCSGALAGYAVTVGLLQAGLPAPATLFVSSQVAPHQGPHSRFLAMTDEQLQDELAGLVRVLGGEPDPSLLALGVGVLRADVEATRRYRPLEPVPVPSRLTAIGWQDDPETTVAQLAGWADCARPGRFRRAVLPGSHYTFLSAPQALLDELAADLALAVAEAAGEPA